MKKKLITLILAAVLVCACAISAFAASYSAYANPSPASVAQGGTVTITVGVSGNPQVKSIRVTPSYDSSVFTLKSHATKLSGTTLDKWDGSNVGVAFDSATAVGAIHTFTFTVSASADVKSYDISFDVLLKNGSTEVLNTTVKASVKVTCAHNFGEYKVVTEAKCETSGLKERTCSKCKEKQSVTLNALGHVLGDDKKIDVESTCSKAGTASGKCTRCQKDGAKVSLPLAAHSYGEWSEKKASTCTAAGVRTHKCTACGHVEDKASLPLGHDFAEGTLISEASISNEGLYEAICKRCGAGGSISSPCSYTDEQTGAYFETEPGVFNAGAQIVISDITEDEAAKDATKDISTKYKAFDIHAVLGEEDVQPNGEVEITLPIPEGYSKNVSIFYIKDDGTVEEVSGIVDAIERTITIKLSHFSKYVLVDLDAVPQEPKQLGGTMLYVAIGEAVVILVLLVLLLSKKKKNTEN